MAKVRIGISGWVYEPWRGAFYPDGLPRKQELSFASRVLNSIEINGTFYSLQRPESFKAWYDATPADFVFSIKCSRYITHIRRLKEIDEPLANFFASGLMTLREKLGPLLWQFPPGFKFDRERLESFLAKLPHTMEAARKLAGQHDDRITGRAAFGDGGSRRIRHAIEIRHDSFRDPTFIDLLRAYNVALVFSDAPDKWPAMRDLTADFVYARLHGDKELYVNGYTSAALDAWANDFKKWKAGRQPADAERASDKAPRKFASRDLYIYFDNTTKVKAPVDARSLMRRLNVNWPTTKK